MDKKLGTDLTKLFQRATKNKYLRTDQIDISYVTTDGATITVEVPTPDLVAQYFHQALGGGNPLFRRLRDQDNFTPVIFSAYGDIFDDYNNEIGSGIEILRLSFTDVRTPAEVYFYDDNNIATSSVDGPIVSEFLTILRAADDNWKKVDFSKSQKPSI
jgi:hypothetical protein